MDLSHNIKEFTEEISHMRKTLEDMKKDEKELEKNIALVEELNQKNKSSEELTIKNSSINSYKILGKNLKEKHQSVKNHMLDRYLEINLNTNYEKAYEECQKFLKNFLKLGKLELGNTTRGLEKYCRDLLNVYINNLERRIRINDKLYMRLRSAEEMLEGISELDLQKENDPSSLEMKGDTKTNDSMRFIRGKINAFKDS